MKKILITFILTALLFIAGILLHQYISDLNRGHHDISGVLQYHKADYTVSADAPEGYFIEISPNYSVYLHHDNISEYLDKPINAWGFLKEICGNDGGSCFPLLDVQWVAKSS